MGVHDEQGNEEIGNLELSTSHIKEMKTSMFVVYYENIVL